MNPITRTYHPSCSWATAALLTVIMLSFGLIAESRANALAAAAESDVVTVSPGSIPDRIRFTVDHTFTPGEYR